MKTPERIALEIVEGVLDLKASDHRRTAELLVPRIAEALLKERALVAEFEAALSLIDLDDEETQIALGRIATHALRSVLASAQGGS